MLLHDLLRQFDSDFPLSGLSNPSITGIQDDSRRVAPGHLFVARSGTKTDGMQYVADAASRGAVAVVTDKLLTNCPLPQIHVPDAAVAASRLANLFYGRPSDSLKVLAVTGTNGKTTTTYLVRHLLAKLGHKCGLIGTVQIDDGRAAVEADMTTPPAVDVARLLAAMRDNGCDACAIETSSHALHQARVAGVTFAGAGFTNLTGDHLDYHGTMEEYADSKAILFRSLPPAAVAAVNADSPHADRMVRDCRARVVRFGQSDKGDYRASDISVTAHGTSFTLTAPTGQARVEMLLIGRHNVENALTAAALVGETFGLTVHQIAHGLRDTLGAPGRLQAVRTGQPFAVLVDYAHTDDALANVLSALRPLARGNLRVLFGCGGDRDRTKRPRMARTAQTYADALYVTSDNPRTEDPQAIINEVLTGIPADNQKPVAVDVDRRRAIERILSDARPDDVVLIAGKGHENYQIVGKTRHHFDDVEEAQKILTRRVVAA